MECYIHPGTGGIATCADCGRPVCATCKVKDERSLCRPCAAVLDPLPEDGAERDPLAEVPLLGLQAKGRLRAPWLYSRAILLGGGAAVVIGLLWGKMASVLGHDTIYFSLFVGFAV